MNKPKVRNYYHVPKTKLKSDIVRRIFCSSPSDSPENSPENLAGKLRRKILLEMIRWNERVVKDAQTPWRTLPFIAQTSSSTSKIRFVLPLKTPRSNLVVFHMRGEKFFIITPTKADNLHKQSLDPISISHKNSCVTHPNKPHTQIPSKRSRLSDFWSTGFSRGITHGETRACCLRSCMTYLIQPDLFRS